MSKFIPVGRDLASVDAGNQSINLVLSARLLGQDTLVSAVQRENGEYDVRAVWLPEGGVMSPEGAHHAHMNGVGKRNGDHFLTHVVITADGHSVTLYLDDVFVGIFSLTNGKLWLDSPENLPDKTKRQYNTIGDLFPTYFLEQHRNFFIDPFEKQDS